MRLARTGLRRLDRLVAFHLIQSASVGALVALALSCPAFARQVSSQAAPPSAAPRTFTALREQVLQIVSVKGARELRVRWTVATSIAGVRQQTVDSFTLLGQTATSATLRRERRPELSADRLVVVVEDAQGRELDWRLVANPRIIRAEWPRADGQFTGRTIEENDIQLAFAIPDLPNADAISIYQPRWTGTDFVLDRLSRLEIEAQP